MKEEKVSTWRKQQQKTPVECLREITENKKAEIIAEQENKLIL